MRTRASIAALKEELGGDIRQLERVLAHNAQAWERIQNGARDYLDWGALAMTLHTAYGLLENYFLRISKFFENNLPPDRWHKALVEKMSLDIPGLRPALFTDEGIAAQAMELLKFRHRIRNLYGEEFDPVKTEAIQGLASSFFPAFMEAHAAFTAKLDGIAGLLP